jgi:hypothetical protein
MTVPAQLCQNEEPAKGATYQLLESTHRLMINESFISRILTLLYAEFLLKD